MRRYSMPVALLVAAAVVLLVAAAGQASGTSDTSPSLVQCTGNPLATYTGGVPGFSATKPTKGHRINTHTANAVGYSHHLANHQPFQLSAAGIAASRAVY